MTDEPVDLPEVNEDLCTECGDLLDENGDCLNTNCEYSPYFLEEDEDDGELPDID